MQPAFFANAPKEDTFHLIDDQGRPDAKKIVEGLTFRNEDVAVAADIAKTKVRYDEKMPPELRVRLIEWATAINLVGQYFRDFKNTMVWFHTSNPMLGNQRPRDMIRIGRYQKLLKFIQTALAENQSP